ncbi:MAG: uracil-DNA glycosylase [Deltaproteobacteria bacterium]|nr:uracil-DNA glycosylase [Deltaproteobacteria bacterium]
MKRQLANYKELAALARETAQLLRSLRARGVEVLPGELREEPPPRKTTAEVRLEEPPTDLGREGLLEHYRKQALECRRCPLASGRRNVVFGDGSSRARVMFIGEGPGSQEDERGLPFVGRAGQLLSRMLAAAGIDRKEVYITNIVKCRPPLNRDPSVEENAACRPFLNRQLELIAPQIVVCLGRVSATSLLPEAVNLGAVRGTVHKLGSAELLVMYHPAYLLRTPSRKNVAWQDIQLLVHRMVAQGILPRPPEPWWTLA